MRKVTVNHAVKHCTGYHRVSLQLSPLNVYLTCHNSWGLIVQTFRLASRNGTIPTRRERLEWADKVLAAFINHKERYESDQVGVHSWRVYRVRDNVRVGSICRVGQRFVSYDKSGDRLCIVSTYDEAYKSITGVKP